MDIQSFKQILTDKFGENIILGIQEGLQPALQIDPDSITEICLELRDNPKCYFDFLSCLSGIDYRGIKPAFGVIYHLSSIPYNYRLTLKAERIVNEDLKQLPSFPTVSSVWKTAEWHEREAYDLFGIHFQGHPDLRRILLPDDWEGYPLRKDYVNAESYRGMKTSR